MPKSLYKIQNLIGPLTWAYDIYHKLDGCRGIYILSLVSKKHLIRYPKGHSNVFYIGQSENIGKRLREHYSYKKNKKLYNHIIDDDTNVYILKYSHGNTNLTYKEKEALMLFEQKYGCIPFCNTQGSCLE